MSTMDSIEEKYEDEIAALHEEILRYREILEDIAERCGSVERSAQEALKEA